MEKLKTWARIDWTYVAGVAANYIKEQKQNGGYIGDGLKGY